MENKSDKNDKILPTTKVKTIIDYAKDNNITRQTVYNRIKEGKIKTIRLGSQQFIPVG